MRAAIAFLLIQFPAFAQEPIKADVKDIVPLVAQVDKDAPVEWINVYDAKQVTLLQPPRSPEYVIFQGRTAGTYKIGYYTLKEGKLSKPYWFVIVVGGAAPTPIPPDPPSPVPVPQLPFHILIVEESKEAAPWRGALLSDQELIRRIGAKGHKFRLVDRDVKDTRVNPPVTPADLRPWFEKCNRYPTTFIVGAYGKELWRSEETPTPRALLAALDKLGG